MNARQLYNSYNMSDINDETKMNDALMEASENGRWDVFNRLLALKEINVNFQDKNGQTALMLASENGRWSVVNRLLDCKEIDLNLQDKHGQTALMLASENGRWCVANRLIDFQKTQIR